MIDLALLDTQADMARHTWEKVPYLKGNTAPESLTLMRQIANFRPAPSVLGQRLDLPERNQVPNPIE